MEFAIVFFHLGAADYQNVPLALAVERNPDAKVVLITDRTDVPRPNGVIVENVNQFWWGAAALSKVYRHANTTPHDFELCNLQRWFVYREWWRSNVFDAVFFADSDVMIFSQLSLELPYWRRHCDYTLSMGTAAGQSYWTDRHALSDFCDIVMAIYAHPDLPMASQIWGHYHNLQMLGKPGGVCDMTFFNLHKRMFDYDVGESTDIVNGATYDHNFLMSQEYEHDGKTKVVTFEGGCPYSVRNDGIRVKFHTLHLSTDSGARSRVQEFYDKARGQK